MHSQTENLGKVAIGPLFAQMALPIIFGLLVNGLYNVVDAIFVTRGVGALAMGGVSIVFPLQMFLFSVASMIGSGMASIVARSLGAKDAKNAELAAGNALWLGGVFSIITMVLALALLEPILRMLGATDQLMPYAKTYAVPLILGIPVMTVSVILGDLLRSEGKVNLMAGLMMLSSLLNIVLDAIFIFVFGWGVFGAAMATVCGVCISTSIASYFYFSGRTSISIHWQALMPKGSMVRGILVLGLPVMIGNAGVSVTVGMANYALAKYAGTNADLLISAYGIIGRVVIFMILPMIGMMVAFQTITSFNYGAKLYQRVLATIRIGNGVATVYAGFCAAVMLLIPEKVVGIFTSDAKLIQEAGSISRIIFLGFVTAGVGIVGSAVFQAMGKARPAMALSLVRVFLLTVPLLIVLPYWFGVQGIWMAFPIGDAMAFVIVAVMIGRQYGALGRPDYQPVQVSH